MGMIRGSLLVVVGVLLFLSFLVGNTFLTLDSSLEYENIRPELISTIRDIAEKDMGLTKEVEERFESMESHCQNYSEFVFSEGGYTFNIPCETILQGPEAIVDKGIGDMVEGVYYKDYDCDFFLDCNKKSQYPFFLVSKKAKDYWKEKFYFSLLASIILITLMLILIEHRLNLPIIVGSLLMISSLPFMKLSWALSLFDFPFAQFLTIFFSKSHSIFLSSLITGLIIFIIGLVLKLFKVGFKINNLFSWIGKKGKEKDLSKNKKGEVISKEHVKEIVKQEISKEKEKTEKPVKKLIEKVKSK